MAIDVENIGRNRAEDLTARRKRWTSEEYHRMAEIGLFDGQRVELIDGEIITMSPMAQPHAICVMKTNSIFVKQMPSHLLVRTQMPLSILGGEPEPDIAVVESEAALDLSQKPTTAALVIEVSDSTIKTDQTTKMSLYAAASIPEYWILNLQSRRLEIHREPIDDAAQSHGFRYGLLRTLNESDEMAPLCAPDVVLKVADLLPPPA